MKNKHLQLLSVGIILTMVLAGYVTNNFHSTQYENNATTKAEILDNTNEKQQISFPKHLKNKVR